MTLVKIVEELEKFDNESTIYVEEPWTEKSAGIVLYEQGLNEEVPLVAQKLRMKYFLEVFVARDFLEDWSISLNTKPTLNQKCHRLIQYAINDA